MILRVWTFSIAAALAPALLWAQGNFEVQVYGSDLVPPHSTMLEFHSNFTVSGSKDRSGIELPTNHQFHETVEITQGFSDYFELGYYNFTSLQPGFGYKWVGTHIRPRFAIPEKWHWPVGLSLSQEIGYQRPIYSTDTWTWEIRPIIDKKLGPWYWSFNPSFDRSLHGPGVSRKYEFAPNFKTSYDVSRRASLGFEYYGSMGPVTGFDPLREQQQMLVPAIDLNLGPDWEFNFGVGVGMTASTDHLLVKFILGRRFKL
jgi:hypothetical protein